MFKIKNKKLKTLFITRKNPPQIGGMENYSYNLIQYFPGEKKVIKLTKPQYHLFWFIPYSIVQGLILGRRADIIHIGDPVMSITGWIIKKVLKKPIVCTLYGLDLSYQNYLYQLYFKLFAKKFDLYVCISRATEKIAHQKNIKNTMIIPVGVSPNLPVMPAEIPAPNGKKILLTVGRLVKRKGVYWFIKNVFSYLKDCVYFIVGDGSEKVKIQNLIKIKKLENSVFMLGRINDEELEKIYQKADLFIMPNIQVKNDLEGFGIVALEAGLRGLPVIASNIEGIKDAITQNQNGILVQEKNQQVFIQTINKFLKDENLGQEFGKKAKEFVLKNFSWQKIARRYYQEFERILNKHTPL